MGSRIHHTQTADTATKSRRPGLLLWPKTPGPARPPGPGHRRALLIGSARAARWPSLVSRTKPDRAGRPWYATPNTSVSAPLGAATTRGPPHRHNPGIGISRAERLVGGAPPGRLRPLRTGCADRLERCVYARG